MARLAGKSCVALTQSSIYSLVFCATSTVDDTQMIFNRGMCLYYYFRRERDQPSDARNGAELIKVLSVGRSINCGLGIVG